MTPIRIFSVVVLLSGISLAPAEEHRAANSGEIRALLGKLEPGDVVVLQSGEWKDQEVRLELYGSAEKLVTIRAESFGDVVFTGDSVVELKGEHGVLENLVFAGVSPSAAKAIVRIRGRDCRMTRCGFFGNNPADERRYHWVQLDGKNNRLDHCAFDGQRHEGVTVVVGLEEPDGETGGHRIDWNYFGSRPSARGENGYETIRIGDSTNSMKNASVVVEHNLFEECDGEIEIISNKSCGNIYRFNTLLRCAGALTLRHGNDCRVEGNVILGEGKKETGGIRVIGSGHVVVGNWIAGTEGRCEGALALSAGQPDPRLEEHHPVKNVRIENNVLVDNREPTLCFDNGFGEDGRTVLPEGISFSGNRFVAREGDAVISPRGAEAANWENDVAVGRESGIGPAPGLAIEDQAPALETPEHLSRDDVGPGVDLSRWLRHE